MGKFGAQNESNQMITVNSMSLKLLGKIVNTNEEMVSSTHQVRSKRPILEERQNKEYLFLDSDIFDVFDHLLEVNLIELLDCKRL